MGNSARQHTLDQYCYSRVLLRATNTIGLFALLILIEAPVKLNGTVLLQGANKASLSLF